MVYSCMPDTLISVTLFWSGAATISYFLYQLAKWTYIYFIAPISLDQYRSGPTEIPWAIVTGASDGIGRGFTEELLAQNFHVLMVARSEEKLQRVQKEIKSTLKGSSPLQLEYVVSDANDLSSSNISKVASALKDRPLAILVNNVGMNNSQKNGLESIPADDIIKLVNVNCTYPTLLTQSLLPHLKKRSRSAILNLSSVAAYMNTAFHIPYAASKAFAHTFSLSLGIELSNSNIDVLSVHPGLVSSNMTKMRSNFSTPTSRSCAQESLKKLGLVEETIPNVIHSLYPITLVSYLPLSFRRQFFFKAVQSMSSNRKKSD